MRTTMRSLAAAAFAVAVVGLTTAQDQPRRPGGFGGGPGGGFGGGPTALLMNKDVQEDVKITDEQKTKLQEWAKENGAKMREKMQDAFKGGGDREKMAAAMAEMNKEVYKEIATVLDEKQVKRLKQIEVQAAGVRAFSQPDVVAALKLTDDQKSKLKDINDEYRKDMQDLAGGNSRPDASKMAALRKETFEKAANVLTDDQKTAWKELTGAAFDTSKLNTGFGGRGGPGGAPGGGRRPGGNNNNNNN